MYLLREMNVKVENISWVIPNDILMTSREGGGGPWSYVAALLSANGDHEKACVDLEEKGVFVRLDKNITPTKFRFPIIGKDELKLLRSVPVPVSQIIRKGRVNYIKLDSDIPLR